MSLGVVDVYADEVPKPTGNVIARGEDGVPWGLYENGYLLFKPVAGKNTLTNNRGETSWKRHSEKIKYVGFAGKVYTPVDSQYLFDNNLKFNPVIFKSGLVIKL